MAEEESPRKGVHMTVRGDVQGVGFRHFTKTTANRYGVKGWVKNMPDGTVEIWAEGREPALKRLLQQVKQGPSHAHVSQVEVDWREPEGTHASFRVRY